MINFIPLEVITNPGRVRAVLARPLRFDDIVCFFSRMMEHCVPFVPHILSRGKNSAYSISYLAFEVHSIISAQRSHLLEILLFWISFQVLPSFVSVLAYSSFPVQV
jgi:hypothetical protein